jgi:hypothetical protein
VARKERLETLPTFPRADEKLFACGRLASPALRLVLIGLPGCEQLERLLPFGFVRLAVGVKGVSYRAHRLKIHAARQRDRLVAVARRDFLLQRVIALQFGNARLRPLQFVFQRGDLAAFIALCLYSGSGLPGRGRVVVHFRKPRSQNEPLWLSTHPARLPIVRSWSLSR